MIHKHYRCIALVSSTSLLHDIGNSFECHRRNTCNHVVVGFFEAGVRVVPSFSPWSTQVAVMRGNSEMTMIYVYVCACMYGYVHLLIYLNIPELEDRVYRKLG